MKVLVISAAFPPIKAPESAHTLYLCEELVRNGVDVQLLTSCRADAAGPFPTGMRVHAVMRDWSWRSLPWLLLNLFRAKPDALLLFYIDWIYQCQPMITFLPTIIRLLYKRASTVCQFANQSGLSGWTPPPLGRLHSAATLLIKALAGADGIHPVYGTLLRDSDRVIAQSEHHLEAFEAVAPGIKQRSTVIPGPPAMRIVPDVPPGSARRKARDKFSLSESEFVIIYFGYLYPLKGIETLILAFGKVAARCASARLMVVGSTEDQTYRDRLSNIAEETGAAGRIVWIGHVEPENDTASLCLHAADLCVLPFSEGVRLNNTSFAVAAAHGLPILTTRRGTLEDVFIDGQNVRLCLAGDPDAMSAEIYRLMSDPGMLRKLRSGSAKLAAECFSWNRIVTMTVDVLSRAIRLKSERPSSKRHHD